MKVNRALYLFFIISLLSLIISQEELSFLQDTSKENKLDNKLINLRNLYVLPDNGCVNIFDDVYAMTNQRTLCIDTYTPPYAVTALGFIVFPKDGILGVVVTYKSGKAVTISSNSKVSVTKGDSVSHIVLVPDMDIKSFAVLFYHSKYFKFSPSVIANDRMYGEGNDEIHAAIVGDKVTLYLVDSKDKTVYTFGPSSFVSLEKPLKNMKAFYSVDGVMNYVLSEDCIRLYNTCGEDFKQYQELCENDPTNFKSIKLKNVKYVAIPAKSNSILSVLFYSDSTSNDQFAINKSTCLNRDTKGDEYHVTIIPKIEDGHVHVYTEKYYSGTRTILESSGTMSLDSSLNSISLAFGLRANAKIINLTDKEVISYNTNTHKYKMHDKNIVIQAGYSYVKNVSEKALWTFDDDEYTEMRVLENNFFFGENEVSYTAEFLCFPAEGISRVYVVDRANSIVDSYNNSQGLVPIDHSHLGGIERIITIAPNSSQIIFARYENFGEFKALLDYSSVIRLASNKYYSFINPTNSPLRIINWSMMNNMKYGPNDAVKDYGTQAIEKKLTVPDVGIYGFVVGNREPINVLADCIILFDDDQYQKNIRRFCMRTKGIGEEKFTIPITGVQNLCIVMTTTDETLVKRKYAGIYLEEDFYENSFCISVDKEIYTAEFRVNKPLIFS